MNSNLLDLTGKVILVAGGSRGIGEQMVRDFAEQGANVVIASRNKDKCAEIAEEVSAEHGVKTLAVRCDMGDVDEIKNMYEEAFAEFKRIDIAVNNAAVNRTKPALEVEEDDFDFMCLVRVCHKHLKDK